MPTTAKFKNLIQYTILAATTVQTIVETAKVPFLVSTSALCLPITKCIETTKLNKEECNEIMEHIHEILCIIFQLHSTSEIKGVLPMAVLYDIAKFTDSDCSSVTGSLAKLGNNSSGSLELQDAVNILIQDSAHVAILGAGGMGKTSLARAVLHIPQVEAKYSHRYFVPCHSSLDCTELAAAIADHIGLQKGLSSRSEVEEFLSLLTDVPHLGLMVTLRCAERPSKVKWSKPFLAPLKPLSNVAAWQTFIEVADDGHDDDSIKELLELTGNLPLAVGLIASVASSEGCAQALSCWKSESTQMLSEGYDQRLSLDISIMLSYTSPRMTTGAQELLSILSLLPDGLTHADLVQAKLPIIDILTCKTTLIQTSLAFVGQDQCLKLLVPIREHILHIHPPANLLKLKLREHFPQILGLWNQFKNLNVGDILPQMSQNLGNFNTVLHDGLEPEGPDVVQNFRSILFLNQFYYRVQRSYSPLLLKLSGQMLLWKRNPIFGEYLIEVLESSGFLPDPNFKSHITLGTQYFKSKCPLKQARWYRGLGMYFQWTKSDFSEALKYYERAYSLAQSIGYPTIVGHHALNNICMIQYLTGKPLDALEHTKEALRYAEHIGDIYGQAGSLYFQARRHRIRANYRHARILLQKSREMLAACGNQQSVLGFNTLNMQAEIHLLKSEYLESRRLQVAIASSCQETSPDAIMANLNIAFIDLASGAEIKNIHQNLDSCQSHLKVIYGVQGKSMSLIADYTATELCLQDGDHVMTNSMFKKFVTPSQKISAAEPALQGLARLSDLSTEMNNIMTTLQWAGVFLSLALECKDKHQTMQAFRCCS
ncbi:hypothetical protein C8J57DRAFT_1512412 [Mycena rebaudengoi]|nr:hypothetical protein C8J57DRAFT_1512412 [Mycena rebaudengoi]